MSQRQTQRSRRLRQMAMGIAAGNPDVCESQIDRRSRFRFRIEQPLQYKVFHGNRVAQSGAGTTSDISSTGVWFTSDSPLTAGTFVQLSIQWPVLLNKTRPLKLVVSGLVVRSSEQGTAVGIESYEFRTGPCAVPAIAGIPAAVGVACEAIQR